MSQDSEFVLYDFPSKHDNECCSPNVWKARAALNFKKVPYKTVLVGYPDIEATCKKLGIPAHPEDSFARYTLPVVQFPDGCYVMDSKNIVNKLEATHATPTLRLNEALQNQAQEIILQIIFPMVPFVFLRVHNNLITEDEKQWYRADREGRACQWLKRDKISLEDWETESGGPHTLLNASDVAMERLAGFLKDHKQDSGPFVLGSQPCYTDLMIVALVEAYRHVGDGAYEKLLASVAGLRELSVAWFARKN